MNIIAVGMIKNSEDVIETFIRANALSVDSFVLLDNMCTDNTIPILTRLIEEGYNVEIIHDEEIGYYQSAKMSSLIRYVSDKYDPDYIVPIDDDEIISTDGGDSLKSVLEQLPDNNIYYMKWRVFVPTEDDDMGEISFAKRISVCFSDTMKTFNKVIIPRKAFKSSEFVIFQGNHKAFADDSIGMMLLKRVRMNHYPCRSYSQLMSKALVGWTSYLSIRDRNDELGKHWKNMYEKIKSGEELSIDDIWSFCMMYLEPFSEDDLSVEKYILRLDPKAFEINYTENSGVNYLKNYMECCEILAEKYSKLSDMDN